MSEMIAIVELSRWIYLARCGFHLIYLIGVPGPLVQAIAFRAVGVFLPPANAGFGFVFMAYPSTEALGYYHSSTRTNPTPT